jgi:hypothetical protein
MVDPAIPPVTGPLPIPVEVITGFVPIAIQPVKISMAKVAPQSVAVASIIPPSADGSAIATIDAAGEIVEAVVPSGAVAVTVMVVPVVPCDQQIPSRIQRHLNGVHG